MRYYFECTNTVEASWRAQVYPRNFTLQKEMCCIVDIAWKQLLLNRKKNGDG